MALETTVTKAGRSEYAIVDALNHDWRELVHRDRGTVLRWSQRHAALATCNSLDDVLSMGQLNSDATLSALLTEVSNEDMLAGRTVLQSMLGRLVRMAQRDRQAGIDDYIAALWCVIRTLSAVGPSRADRGEPVDGRLQGGVSGAAVAGPRRGDALAARTVSWKGSSATGWPGSGGCPTPTRVSPTAVEVLSAGFRLRLIDEPTRRLLHSVYVDGLSSDEAARRHLTSPGSVRVRSSKAVKRLAAHAARLAEAAQLAEPLCRSRPNGQHLAGCGQHHGCVGQHPGQHLLERLAAVTEPTARGGASSGLASRMRRGDLSPVRLCCAISDFAQALAPRVPQIGTGLILLGRLCDCDASRTEESPWRSGCGAS